MPDKRAGAVRAAAEAWTAAIADRDAERACRLMTERARRQLRERQGGESCEEAVRRIGRALGPDPSAELRALRVSEVRQTTHDRVVATLGAGGPELGLEQRSGRWLVGDLMTAVRAGGGGSYPPPPARWAPRPPEGS